MRRKSLPPRPRGVSKAKAAPVEAEEEPAQRPKRRGRRERCLSDAMRRLCYVRYGDLGGSDETC